MGIQQLEQPVADAKMSAPSLPQRNAKIDSLTGLRFIAACLVFMSHILPSAHFPAFVRAFISSGGNGVGLFFILSGFVLCFNYYDAFSTRFAASLKSFFVARFARIYPLHFLLFLLFFAAISVSTQPQPLLPILAQLTLTQAWTTDLSIVGTYNSVAWSVSVEAFLYLCFPLLVLLLFKRATKIWHLCLIGFVAFSAIFSLASWFSLHGITSLALTSVSSIPLLLWVYVFPATRLGDFILGCVAARIYVLHISKPISRRGQTLGISLLLLSIVAVIILMGSSDPFLLPYQLDSGFSLPFVFIMYTLARYVTPLSKLLSTKLLILLGEASYAFYLLHVMLLHEGLAIPYYSGRLSGYLYIVMEFLLIVIVALGVHTYVEAPLRKIIRHIFASRASFPPSASPVPTIISS